MPVDASIPLSVQNPQVDLAGIYATAMQLRQMQQQQQFQNSLKAILTSPDAVDTKTGQPTSNTLAQIARLGPQGLEFSTKVSDQQAQSQQRQAETRHATAQATQEETAAAAGALKSGLDIYDGELASGGVSPDIAEQNLKASMHEWINSQPWDQARRDRNWQALSSMNPTQLRAAASKLSMTQAQQEHQATLTEERVPATMGGKPVEVDKEDNVYDPNTHERVPVTAPIIKQEPGFNPQAAAAKVEDRPPTLLNDAANGNKQYLAYFGPKGTKPEYTDLDGQPYEPKSATHIAGGQPRSAISIATQKYLEEHPDAKAEDVAEFAGEYGRIVTAGTADVKARAAGLSNLGKMQASVEQAEGNATKEADLVESLLAKGGIHGIPSAFGKWQNSVRTGVFNDPDASAFQTATESLKNEYVKVLSTTGGMSGGMSSDAARREADTYINPRLSQEQIEANIAVMRRSMANRTAAIKQAYDDTREKVAEAGEPDAVPRGAPPPTGKTATGPNGRKIVLSGGRWVDMKTGEPVQ